MGIGKWWKQMKETYGDLPPKQAFMAGKMDGKVLTMTVHAKKQDSRAKRRQRRKEIACKGKVKI